MFTNEWNSVAIPLETVVLDFADPNSTKLYSTKSESVASPFSSPSISSLHISKWFKNTKTKESPKKATLWDAEYEEQS